MKLKLLLILCVFLSSKVSAQEIFHQDIFYGGVTAEGFSTGHGNGSGTIQLHIEPGSIIRKAFLFTYTLQNPAPNTIIINNTPFLFDASIDNCTMSVEHPSSSVNVVRLVSRHITYFIKNNITNFYNITIPSPNMPNPLANESWWTAFLYIEYENSSLSKIATTVLINDQKMIGFETYNVTDLNPINTSNPVSFSLYTDRVAAFLSPNTQVKLNNFLLGTIGGSDLVNNSWNYGGAKGHFYYQNSSIYGLDDDIPNAYMDSSDALADISSYLTSNVNSFNFQLKNTNNPQDNPNRIGIHNGFFLAHTTPCDTFSVSVTPDTTVCYGEQVQLQVTGGLTYEWSASTASQDTTNSSGVPGLSCSTCPNPVFTGDHSMSYTVRIWNNDSCSVVRPVHITVSHPQKVNCYIGETKCGASTGNIKALTLPEDMDDWYVVTPNNDTLDQPIGNTFSYLEAGNYSVYYIDSLGCKSEDTVVKIEKYNTTVADFSVNPTTGSAPLEVDINNQSQNATDFEWLINGVSSGTTPTTFFDTSGVYQIGLIAWEIDALCADTTWKTVIVFDSLVVELPNVFTPNNDGTNDYFNVKVNLPVYYKLSLLNRWGNVVFENEGEIAEGTHQLRSEEHTSE